MITTIEEIIAFLDANKNAELITINGSLYTSIRYKENADHTELYITGISPSNNWNHYEFIQHIKSSQLLIPNSNRINQLISDRKTNKHFDKSFFTVCYSGFSHWNIPCLSFITIYELEYILADSLHDGTITKTTIQTLVDFLEDNKNKEIYIDTGDGTSYLAKLRYDHDSINNTLAVYREFEDFRNQKEIIVYKPIITLTSDNLIIPSRKKIVKLLNCSDQDSFKPDFPFIDFLSYSLGYSNEDTCFQLPNRTPTITFKYCTSIIYFSCCKIIHHLL